MMGNDGFTVLAEAPESRKQIPIPKIRLLRKLPFASYLVHRGCWAEATAEAMIIL